MQEAVKVFKGVKEDIVRARDDLVRARTDISLASSEISQNLSAEMDTNSPADEPLAANSGADSGSSATSVVAEPIHVESFERMYKKAKRYYRAAVQKYTQNHQDDATFNPGDDWIEITKHLRDLRDSYFDPGRNKDRWYADWVIEMIETERRTRRNRTSRLDPEQVKRLEESQPPD